MTHTGHRTVQYIGLLLILGLFAVGYWYFQVRAGVRVGTGFSQPGGVGRGESSLVGYFPLDENTGTTTANASTNTLTAGTLTLGPTWTTGMIGAAVEFDGSDDYIVSADDALLDLAATTDDMTITGWFYRDEFTTDDVIVAKRTGVAAGNTGYLVEVNAADDLYFEISDGTNEFSMTSTESFGVVGWNHFAVVFNEDDVDGSKIYVNGAEDEGRTTVGTITSVAAAGNASAFAIGAESDGGAPFNGKIDEIRVYNRTLAAAEINEIAKLRLPTVVEATLEGYWSMDGSSNTGTIIRDLSGTRTDGTLSLGAIVGDGVVGQGLYCDGTDDHLVMGDITALDLGDTEDVTISGWFKRLDATTDDVLLAKHNGELATDVGYHIFIDGTTDLLTFAVADGTDIYTITSVTTFTDVTKWYHFTLVWDQDSAANSEIYINGVADGATDVGTIGNIGNLSNALDFRLCRESDGGRSANVQMDEVRVHKSVLTAAQIIALYDIGNPDKLNSANVQPQGTNDPLNSGLLGYWPFNGPDISGTTAYDRSTGGNNGTITGAPPMSPGPAGQAINMDGSTDYVTIGDIAALDMNDTADFSISAWFKRETYDSGDVIVAKRNSFTNTDVGYIMDISATTDEVVFEVSDGTDEYRLTSRSTFLTDEWNHVVVVFDQDSDANSEMYINGAPQNAPPTGDISLVGSLENAISLRIGVDSDLTGTTNFYGGLDEVRIYNRVLSAAEAKSLYDVSAPDRVHASASQPMGTGRLDSGISGYWPLDNGSGTAASDVSVNSTNGTLTLGPTWTTGQINSAVDFDGSDDYVTVADAATLDFADGEDLTITGWFNRDTATTDDTIIAKKNGITAADTGYLVYLDDATDQLIFHIADGTDQFTLTSTSTFTTTGWNHFAVVWRDGTNEAREIYINGGNNAATPAGTIGNINAATNAVALNMGAESDGGVPFDGKLDEIRVYDRPLFSYEVADLYRLTSPTGGIDTSLKGYWSMNGSDVTSTTVYDRSGARNTGTINGNPVLAPGKLGQAIDFDGTGDFVEIADNPIMDVGDTEDFSIALWFNRENIVNAHSLYSKRQGFLNTETGYIFDFNASTGRILFEISDGTDEYSVNTAPFFSTGWHHIVVVWDQDSEANTDVYIDGVSVGVEDSGTIASIGDLTNALPSRIGSQSDSGGRMEGKIDEVRFYKRVLSADEIQTLYAVGR